MTNKPSAEPIREDIVRQLEQFPVEVLEMALRIIEAREAKERSTRSGT
jgi:hypothetical protein